MIGHEEGFEPSGFQLLRKSFDVREIEISIGEGTRISPGTGVNADRAHEGTEPESSSVSGIRHDEFAPRLIEAEPCFLKEWDNAGAKKFEIGCEVKEVDLYPVATRLF